LGHAWATFVKAPFRHILGTLLSGVQALLCIIFLALEINVGFVDYNRTQSAAFGFIITAELIFGVFVPLAVFIIEFRKANASAARADNHALLMYVVRKERYDISVYGSDFEGSNSSGDAADDDLSPHDLGKEEEEEEDYAASVSEDDEDKHPGLDIDIGVPSNFENTEDASPNYRQPLLPSRMSSADRSKRERNEKSIARDNDDDDEEKRSGYDSNSDRNNNLSYLRFFRDPLPLSGSRSDGELTSLVSFRTANGEMKQEEISPATDLGSMSLMKDDEFLDPSGQQRLMRNSIKWKRPNASTSTRQNSSTGKQGDKPLISQDDLTALELMKTFNNNDKSRKAKNFDSYAMMV
jgi:hypothetical protein